MKVYAVKIYDADSGRWMQSFSYYTNLERARARLRECILGGELPAKLVSVEEDSDREIEVLQFIDGGGA